jgi:hypothetical protein
MDEDDFINCIKIGDNDTILNNLTEIGNAQFDKLLFAYIQQKVYDIFNNMDFQFNDRGLVFVERVIDIPPTLNKDELIKLYDNHVGICWTWELGHGYEYCSAETNYDSLRLRGYVDVKDIDIIPTLYFQMYDLSIEEEIRVRKNAPIEIFEIIDDDGRVLPLKQSIIVNA